jgi:hypothetical protein
VPTSLKNYFQKENIRFHLHISVSHKDKRFAKNIQNILILNLFNPPFDARNCFLDQRGVEKCHVKEAPSSALLGKNTFLEN